MSLPVPHLQFLVLSITKESEQEAVSGAIIRKQMKDRHGLKREGPNFYQMMKRMERARLLKSEYRPWNREVAYRITKTGHKALMKSYGFYLHPGMNLPEKDEEEPGYRKR